MRDPLFWVLVIGLAAGCGSSSKGSPSSGAGGAGTGGHTEAGAGGSAGGGASAGAAGADGGVAGGSGFGGAAGSGGAGGAGTGGTAGAGGATSDTCPVPTGVFQVDRPPGPEQSALDHTVLQVPSSGPAGVLTGKVIDYVGYSQSELDRLDHDGPNNWSRTTLWLGNKLGGVVPDSVAATDGADPCAAYIEDYNRTLHMQCTSLSDRVIAPHATASVSMADAGGIQQVVYVDKDTLHWVKVNGTAGQPETIDTAWQFGSTSMAVDASGTPHVAYVTLQEDNTRTVHYATRTSSGWQTETVADDTSSSLSSDSLSMVLVGGQPVIAYYLCSTRSLHLARHTSQGFSSVTLEAPAPGYPGDKVGQSVVLQADCMGRLHVVFQRSLTTDPTPNLGLYYADIDANDKLVAPTMLPRIPNTPLAFMATTDGLSFYIAPDGKQYVAAELDGPAIYFASR